MPRRSPFTRVSLALATVAPLLVSSGCSTVGYYSQAIGGHLALMRAREPIAELLSDADTDPALRAKLETLTEARAFAVRELALPDNDSYSSYVATGRRAVTWNVVAAAEFSVNARTWCFPVAGCVNYRGYFDEQEARDYAAALATTEGFDVTVGGASAYSTLGWFDDPVLDTMLRGDAIRYVGTLFHELAHQVLYVQDDSDFNEAYATFVERTGVRLWLSERGEADRIAAYEDSLDRGEDFVALLKSTREELQALYAEPDLDDATRRERKAEVFAGMRERYAELKVSWNDYAGYDGWFSRELNNARLVAVSTYRRLVPAFAALYVEAGEDIGRFHELAAEVGALEPPARRTRLDALTRSAAAASPGRTPADVASTGVTSRAAVRSRADRETRAGEHRAVVQGAG